MTALAPPEPTSPPAPSAAALDALRRAVAGGGEHRLYRAGKLPGLFAPRAEAARQAVAAGWLDVVRTEAKGKLVTEWVRATPAAVRIVHEHDSPELLLREFQTLFASAQGEVPALIADGRRELASAAERFERKADELLARLDGLADRLDAALRRVDLRTPVASGLRILVPWGADALHYLDRRRAAGAPAACPLGELFAALREANSDLTLADFHDGLLRMRDGRSLRLTAADGGDVEYALLDGAELLTHAER